MRKLPQCRERRSGGGSHDWKTATVAYLRATAASLVSLGSTSSPKDWCAKPASLQMFHTKITLVVAAVVHSGAVDAKVKYEV